MEKPIRRKGSKGSFMRSIEAKNNASKENIPSKVDGKDMNGKTATSTARTYHIPATAAIANAPDARNSFIGTAVKGSESTEDVDLDLSFDFVSKMEGGGTADSAQSFSSVPASASMRNNEHGQSPRGMSNADWGSRSRKKPPTPLSLGRKKANETGVSIDLTSQFSPDSPTKSTRNAYDDTPLTIVPISATRRAADSDVHGERNAMTALITDQRVAAAKRQNANNGKASRRPSPSKRNAQGPTALSASPKKATGKSNKIALTVNKAKTNAQVAHNVEQEDVFVTDEVITREHGKTGKVDKADPVETSSTDHDGIQQNPQRSRPPRSRHPSAQDSVDSNYSIPQSFKTSATSKTTSNFHEGSEVGSVGGDHGFSMSPSAENVLGLILPQHQTATVMPRIETTASSPPLPSSDNADQAMTPLQTQKSTPSTPFSAIFSTSDDGLKSDAISSTGGRTPATAVSTLFGENQDEGKLEMRNVESLAMMRGATAPIPAPSAIAAQIIKEESILSSIERPQSVPPSTSLSGSQHSALAEHVRKDSVESSEQSSVEGGAVQKMIVDTKSSPEVEKPSFDLTQVTGTSGKKGPWPQSPLLLDNEKQDVSPKGIGLGLFMGKNDGGDFGALEDTQSSILIQRAELSATQDYCALGLDLNAEPQSAPIVSMSGKSSLVPPRNPSLSMGKTKNIRGSNSEASVTDAFAINVTPPAPVHSPTLSQPDHRVDVPSSIFSDGDKEELMGSSDRLPSSEGNRWSSKLWSMASAFRSPVASTFDDARQSTSGTPPMRALTLVSRQETDKHRSKESVQTPHATSGDSVYNAFRIASPSATIPAQARFDQIDSPHEEVARPQAAMYSDARSSRQLQRPVSGIRYVTNQAEDHHIQLDMDSGNNANVLDEIKSPRVAASPTGMTPKMEFLSNAKLQRRSWTSNAHEMNAATSADPRGASPWLAPKRQSLTGARDSELYNLASTVQQLLRQTDGVDEDAVAVEAILGEEGLRRRANHRSVNSAPNTPTFAVDAWTKEEVDEQAEGDDLDNVVDNAIRGPSVMFQDADVSRSHYEGDDDGRRSRLSIYRRPKSGLPSSFKEARRRYLPSTMEEEVRPSSSMPYLHLKARRPSTMPTQRSTNRRMSGLLTRHDGEEDGLFAYSGKALQNANPSRTLFFCGFLMMPWLWFIGGWALDADGLVYVQHEKGYGSGSPYKDRMRTAAQLKGSEDAKDANDASQYADHADGTLAEARPNINHNDSPFIAQIDDDDVNATNPNNDGRGMRRRKHLSYGKFLYRLSGISAKEPSSRWSSDVAQKDDQDGSSANSSNGAMMGGEMQRRQRRAKATRLSPEEEWPIVRAARSAFDWRKLDTYVVANRVMALVASLIVMGGLGAAIAAVVLHWH